MILALSETSISVLAKAWMMMFGSVEYSILANIQSKTGISRRLGHAWLRWLGVGKYKVSESTENWAHTGLFAKKIKKNSFLVVILSQLTSLNAIFSETDYSMLLFSVKYEGTFSSTPDDVQHTRQEGALGMLFFYTKFSMNNSRHW